MLNYAGGKELQGTGTILVPVHTHAKARLQNFTILPLCAHTYMYIPVDILKVIEIRAK